MSRRAGAAAAPHAGPPGPRRPVPTIDLEAAGSTPILREYRAVKAQHPDAVVMARLGDFFEMFGQDAEVAAPILGVALTGRGFGSAGRLPMCGVPHHSAVQYIRRLLEAGLRVVLWDQLDGSPLQADSKLVQREVTRVLSPGTLLDEAYLEPAQQVRCIALAPRPGRVGVAALDASTGDLQLAELPGGLETDALAEEVARLAAGELLVPEGVEVPPSLAAGVPRTVLPAAGFDAVRGAQRLRELGGLATLRGLGAERLGAAHAAAGALIGYCERSRIRLAPGFIRVMERPLGALMRLDAPTRRNLELTGSLSGDHGGLAALVDRTRTPMGARRLRSRLVEPLTDAAAIDADLDAVAALHADREIRDRLRGALRGVRDLERLAGRCVQRLASPRDLVALGGGLQALDHVRSAVLALADPPPRLRHAAAACVAPDGLSVALAATLVDEPPSSLRDGGAIRPGADTELDALLATGADARAYIASLEERERARSGIRALKVGYNRVFGYYLEVPNTSRAAVPGDYVRKQTLVGAERYITQQLREQEAVVLSTRARCVAREAEVIAALLDAVAAEVGGITAAAGAVAVVDTAQSLAEAADEHGWVRPVVDDSTRLVIEAGRHPVVEQSLDAGTFVPNDCVLCGRDLCGESAGAAQLLLLTGPNMAGKSTYLRQVALVVLLAQLGSFVPARRAHIGVCDRIFTRVGAQDDLAGGLSTFMVEMTETAAILHQATGRSLVVLDEIGRGTSTYDGLSIAQAVVEHLHDAPHLGCRTLFATHYHELTALAGRLAGVRNARVEVVEEGEAVTFLHRIVEGGADRSYGIHVARLAGIPAAVVLRARGLLAELEAGRPLGPAARSAAQLALPLEPAAEHPVMEELGRLDVDGLTPLEALNKLAEWRARMDTVAPERRVAPR